MTYSKQFALALAFVAATACGCASMKHNEDNDESEREVTVDQLPPAVKATLMRELKDGKIEDIKLKTDSGTSFYEADLLMNGNEVELQIALDGKVLSNKIDKESEGEEKDGGKKED